MTPEKANLLPRSSLLRVAGHDVLVRIVGELELYTGLGEPFFGLRFIEEERS